MKTKFIVPAVLCIALCTAFVIRCDENVKGNGKVVTKERALGSFHKINHAGNIDIFIDQNGKEAASVETDENLQEYILTEVKNGELHIHVKEKYNVDPTKLIVHISCSKLDELNSAGSGDVAMNSKITGDRFSVSHGGSGDVNLLVAVKKLDISAAGSGDFEISGSADVFSVSTAGSGNLEAKQLTCNKADISMAGSGDVTLSKGTTASVSRVGSGEVSYE